MTDNNNHMVDTIIAEFEAAVNTKKVIPLEKLSRWMKSDNIEILGVVFSYIIKDNYNSYIFPYLKLIDYHNFFMRYFTRCLIENPSTEWTDSRYLIGWSVVQWFNELWADKDSNQEIILEMKNWLAELYKKGDEELRICIITATLEHLFENNEIKVYFKDWNKDSILIDPYEEAIGYANELRKKSADKESKETNKDP